MLYSITSARMGCKHCFKYKLLEIIWEMFDQNVAAWLFSFLVIYAHMNKCTLASCRFYGYHFYSVHYWWACLLLFLWPCLMTKNMNKICFHLEGLHLPKERATKDIDLFTYIPVMLHRIPIPAMQAFLLSWGSIIDLWIEMGLKHDD